MLITQNEPEVTTSSPAKSATPSIPARKRPPSFTGWYATLIILVVMFILGGFGEMLLAKSVLHEIAALIAWLIAAMCFCALSIIDVLRRR